MGIKRMWIAVDRSGRCRRFLPPHVVQGRFATARQSEPVIFLARKLGRSMYTGPTVVKLSKMKVVMNSSRLIRMGGVPFTKQLAVEMLLY